MVFKVFTIFTLDSWQCSTNNQMQTCQKCFLFYHFHKQFSEAIWYRGYVLRMLPLNVFTTPTGF